MTTSNDIANQALQLIGDNMPNVVGLAPTFDNSTAGRALQKLYTPCVQTVGRQFGWDFARNTVALTLSGNASLFGWSYEYLYPSNGIELWQLLPTLAAQQDANPLPINCQVYNTLVGGIQTKVIGSNLLNALGVYNNSPAESTWDPMFREAVVRLLSSELSMALFGRPDSSEAYLQSGAAMESIGEQRSD